MVNTGLEALTPYGLMFPLFRARLMRTYGAGSRAGFFRCAKIIFRFDHEYEDASNEFRAFRNRWMLSGAFCRDRSSRTPSRILVQASNSSYSGCLGYSRVLNLTMDRRNWQGQWAVIGWGPPSLTLLRGSHRQCEVWSRLRSPGKK